MAPEIKDIKKWEQAERWLARHGYGLTQIQEQKLLWEKAQKPAAPVKPVAAKTVTKTTATVKK